MGRMTPERLQEIRRRLDSGWWLPSVAETLEALHEIEGCWAELDQLKFALRYERDELEQALDEIRRLHEQLPFCSEQGRRDERLRGSDNLRSTYKQT